MNDWIDRFVIIFNVNYFQSNHLFGFSIFINKLVCVCAKKKRELAMIAFVTFRKLFHCFELISIIASAKRKQKNKIESMVWNDLHYLVTRYAQKVNDHVPTLWVCKNLIERATEWARKQRKEHCILVQRHSLFCCTANDRHRTQKRMKILQNLLIQIETSHESKRTTNEKKTTKSEKNKKKHIHKAQWN